MDMLMVLAVILVVIALGAATGLVIMAVQAKRIDRMYVNQAKVDALRYILSLLAKAAMAKLAKGEDALSKAYAAAREAYSNNPKIDLSTIKEIFNVSESHSDVTIFYSLVVLANIDMREMTVEELRGEILGFEQLNKIIDINKYGKFMVLLDIMKRANSQGKISDTTAKIMALIGT